MPPRLAAQTRPDPQPDRKPRGKTHSYTPFRRSSDGRWVIQVEVSGKAGQRRRRTVTGRTEREVRKKLRPLLEALARTADDDAVTQDPTVGELLASWLQDRTLAVSPNTFESYVLQCRHLAPLHAIRVRDLTRARVTAHLADFHAGKPADPAAGTPAIRAHKPRSANVMLDVLRMALRWGEDEYGTPNVASRVAPVREERSPAVPFEPADVERILRATGPKRDMWAVLFGTGCRIGELCGLRKSDWLPGGLLRIEQQLRRVPPRVAKERELATGSAAPRSEVSTPKTTAGVRHIRPAEFAVEVLDRLAAECEGPDDFLFRSRKGTPHHPRTANRDLVRLERRLGVTKVLPPHSVRHTVAAQLLAAGANLDDVKRYLGHTSIAHTSDLYGHWIEARTRDLGAHLTTRLMPDVGAIQRPTMADRMADEPATGDHR
jgi:integrase